VSATTSAFSSARNDTNVWDYAASFVDPSAEIVSLACGPESGTRPLLLLETLKPRVSANDQDILGLKRTITTPFGPTIIWTTGVALLEELIEDDVNAAVAKAFAKRAHTLLMFVIGLSIAEEDFRHKTYRCEKILTPG